MINAAAAEDEAPPSKRMRPSEEVDVLGSVVTAMPGPEDSQLPGVSSSALGPLQEFVHRQGIAITEGLQFKSTGHGIGGVAMRRFPQGTVLMTIPRTAILTISKAVDSPVGLAVRKVVANAPPMACMYALMVHERFGVNDQSAAANPWTSYIQSLPAEFNDALWFTDDELRFLEGTNVYHQVETTRQQLLQYQCQVAAAAAEDTTGVLGDPAMYNLKGFQWARSAFMSRCFTSQVAGLEGCSEGCLVPVLDLLNHHPSAKALWDIRPDDLQFRLEEDLEAGMEVFNNYGPKGNEELLMNYGFVLDDNPADTITIKLGLPTQLSDIQNTLIQKWDLQGPTYPIHPNHLNESLLLMLGVLAATPEQQLFLQHDAPLSNVTYIKRLGPALALEALTSLYRNIYTKLHRLGPMPVEANSDNLRHIQIYLSGQRSILNATLKLILQEYQALHQTITSPLKSMATSTSADDRSSLIFPSQVLHADRCIAAGESVMALPLEQIITVDQLKQTHPLFAKCLQHIEGLEDEIVLCLWLLSTLNDVDTSEIKHANPLYLWPTQDMAPLGEDLLTAAMEKREELVELHQQLFPALSKSFPRLFKRKNCKDLQQFLRLAAVVDIHAIPIPMANSCTLALLRSRETSRLLKIRHSSRPNSLLWYNSRDGELQIKALCDMNSGDIITVNHGPLDNSALLLKHGECCTFNLHETITLAVGRKGDAPQSKWILRKSHSSTNMVDVCCCSDTSESVAKECHEDLLAAVQSIMDAETHVANCSSEHRQILQPFTITRQAILQGALHTLSTNNSQPT